LVVTMERVSPLSLLLAEVFRLLTRRHVLHLQSIESFIVITNFVHSL
jgi:hypothetical protein